MSHNAVVANCATDAALTAYLGLFAASFIAATLLPAQSELLVAALVAAGRHDVAALLLVATLGNVLGSVLNWALGRFLSAHRNHRWSPVPRRALARAEGWYARWGAWTLLLSWVPLVGDPLTLAAGIFRTPILRFVAIVTVAKTARYAFVVAAALQFR